MIFGKHVAIAEDREEHIRKHGLGMPVEEIVRFADKITQGQEGLHVFHGISKTITIAVRGTIALEGQTYGIVRTIWDDNAGNADERTGLPVINHFEPVCRHALIPYASWPCPFCD